MPRSRDKTYFQFIAEFAFIVVDLERFTGGFQIRRAAVPYDREPASRQGLAEWSSPAEPDPARGVGDGAAGGAGRAVGGSV